MKFKSYSHILQKTGVLRNFTVAKVVKKEELDGLKQLIRDITTSDSEYQEILREEMKKISNMHDKNNPVPGIIYGSAEEDKKEMLVEMASNLHANLKKYKLSSSELAFLVTAIITQLGLTKDDFENLRDKLMDGDDGGEE